MALRDTIRYALTRQWPAEPTRSHPVIPWDEFVNYFQFGNFLPYRQTINSNVEEIDPNFSGLVQGAYASNGIVFAAMLARMMLFSEARFQFQQLRGGRPGDLFGNADLSILERPWPGATTGDLLARAITDVDLGGNFFAVLRPGRIARLRPDWVDIVLGSNTDSNVRAGDIDADVLGYIYHPGGRYSDREPVNLLREQVAHFAPIPDPLASYRGMSWLTPIIREIQSDTAATNHKRAFFQNGATPNMKVTFDPPNPEDFDRLVESFREKHEGVANAYKTLFLLAGTMDAEVIGADMKQIDFKQTQGAGETRIAAASGIHAVILGLSEGLQGSSLNTGNFQAAKRLTAEKTLRPLWRNLAGSLETIIPVPDGSRLWYDDRHIPFLQEDVKDAAEVMGNHASAIRTLTDGGYTPESVVDAVTSGDLKRLVHTQLLPVQLQPPNPNGNTDNGDEAPRSVALLDLQRRALLTGGSTPKAQKRTPEHV